MLMISDYHKINKTNKTDNTERTLQRSTTSSSWTACH